MIRCVCVRFICSALDSCLCLNDGRSAASEWLVHSLVLFASTFHFFSVFFFPPSAELFSLVLLSSLLFLSIWSWSSMFESRKNPSNFICHFAAAVRVSTGQHASTEQSHTPSFPLSYTLSLNCSFESNSIHTVENNNKSLASKAFFLLQHIHKWN